MKRRKSRSVRFLQHHHIRKLLGLNTSKLPFTLESQFYTLKGLQFRLLPSNKAGVRSRPHRLEVECNVCCKWMSVGRFNQHQGTHPDDQLSELSKAYLNHELDAQLYGDGGL